MERPPERPVPKLLIWGLVGGMILFTIILIAIFLGREKPDYSSESRSASPPQ